MMLDLLFSSYWYWFIAAVILLILEILMPGVFLLWLGLGAAIVGLFLLAVPGAGLAWQLLVLAVSICVAVAAGLKWQKKLLNHQPHDLNQGFEGFIGRNALVSQAFQHGSGRIRLEDSTYTAYCEVSDLGEGQPVEIVAVKGNKLVVKPQ